MIVFLDGLSRVSVQGGTVIADGLDRAGVHRFETKFGLGGRLRLFVNVGIAVLVVSGEIGRRRIPADVAVYAHSVNIELARDIIRQFVLNKGHNKSPA